MSLSGLFYLMVVELEFLEFVRWQRSPSPLAQG